MSQRQIRRTRERRSQRETRRQGRLAGAGLGASAALGAAALFAPAAQADTLEVTNLNNVNDGGSTPCTDDPGDCSLNEATVEANQNGEADVITFASGLTGTIEIDDDLELYNEALEIQGPGASVITVDAQDLDQVFYAFAFDEPDTPVTISGLTITGGDTVGAVDGYGGGIESVPGSDEAAELTLANMVITGNYALYDGGGVYSDEGSLTITNSVISDNISLRDGGGVSVEDTDGDQATEVLISQSVFSGNETTYYEGDGGGIYLDDIEGAAVIERSTFTSNESNDGGGIYVDEDIEAPVTIQSSTVSGNRGVDRPDGEPLYAGDAGGIAIDNPDEAITLLNSTVSGNSAEGDGGGIYVDSDDDDEEAVEIRNTTIAGNTSDQIGGGVYRAFDESGGTYYGDDVTLRSSIVADNTADTAPDLGEGPDIEGIGEFIAGFSLIESTGGATPTATPAGSNVTGQDPQLGPLANNGGPTQTHAPGLGSPALDKGVADGLGTDQRGLARTSDLALVPNGAGSDATDIGAVEIQVADVEAQCQGATARKLNGTAGDDTLTGTDIPDSISGLAGNDAASGAGGNDCVNGDEGRDNAKGGPGKDIVKGGAGKDKGSGGGGKDKVKGNAGKDRLKGGGKNDKLSGAGGKDVLKGGGGKDRLKGGPGKDKLAGGGGKDRFNCGGGTDKVIAQEKDKVSASCEKVVEKG